MHLEQALPKDPFAAAQLLADLTIKDEDGTVCRYPTCHAPRQNPKTTGGTGRPGAYCHNPDHTALTNHRARRQLRESAARVTVEEDQKEVQPGSITLVEPAHTTVLNRITQLQNELTHYLSALSQLADPDLSLAYIQATLDRAEARVAEAQQNASTEHSLRLIAEKARLAMQEEAQAEHEAAEQAIVHMEEAEATSKRIQDEAEKQIASLQVAHVKATETIRLEAQQQQEEIEKQAREKVNHAHEATAQALEEAKQANIRTHEATAQVTTADRLLREVREVLQRERAEVDRLRAELTETVKEARLRAEADRAELAETIKEAQLRAETERAEVRAALERERAEVDRLRAELASTHERADQLAHLSDQMRVQLLQRQVEQ